MIPYIVFSREVIWMNAGNLLQAVEKMRTFWKCKYGEDVTIKEFENYMIGIENS